MPVKMTDEEFKKRLKLYNSGMSDKEIAEELNISRQTVRSWRHKNNLDNSNPQTSITISDINHETLLKYYKDATGDKEIADKIGCSPNTVRIWRLKNNLPAKRFKNKKYDMSLVMKYYKQGLTDGKIAEKIGSTPSTIWRWRKDNNLECNYTPKKYNIPEYIIIDAVNTGCGIPTVSKTFGVSPSYIRHIMTKNGIKARMYGRRCQYCGKIFTTKLNVQKRCHECHKFQKASYGDIKEIRKQFYTLLRKNPEEAMKIKSEMFEEEGLGFMEFALNGICPEKVYESDGYNLIIENGGVLFIKQHVMTNKSGNIVEYDKNNIRQLKQSYEDELYRTYMFINGTNYGTTLIIHYINPFECVNALIKVKGYEFEKYEIISMCTKIFKQHRDYVLNEVGNEESEYYKWDKSYPINKIIFEKLLEVKKDE